MSSRRVVLTLTVALVSLLWVAGSARAQTQAPPDQPQATPPPAAAPAPADQPAAAPAAPAEPAAPAAAAPGKREYGEEIVVTGSRIRRKDLTTPAPVTVMSRDQVLASGKVSLGDFLQSLPEQGNSINQQVNNGGDGSTRVNLRGLGDARTLVLVNGRRFVGTGYLPTFSETTVDLNSIPTSAIERIEILKDGASAVYGSDAIGGVVNIITRKSFNGVEASAYTGTSSHGDGTTYDVNATVGTSSDKGSVMVTAGFQKQLPIFSGDRDWGKTSFLYDWTTGEAIPSGSPSNPAGRFSIKAPCAAGGGNALLSSLCTGTDPKTGAAYGPNIMYDPTAPLGYRTERDGIDFYNFQPINYLVTPIQRIQAFSTGEAAFSPFARAYYEASLVNRQSSQQLAEEPITSASGPGGLVVSKDSLYNPIGVDITSFGRRLTEFGPRHFSQELDTFRTVLGVNGTLPDATGPLAGWYWDLNVNYGRSWGNQTNLGYMRTDRLSPALGPSMISPTTGQPICVSRPGDATSVIEGCVPINLFHVGGGSIDPSQVNYLGFTGTSRATLQLFDGQATASGELFPLLADRPVGLAVGYEYRREFGSNIPDPIAGAGQASEGNFVATAGGYYSNELYGELSIPILSGIPFVQNLEATAAVRYSNYSNFGSQATYKFGARYSPIADFTLRGTYSTAFRAPQVSDLFLGRLDNFPNVSDPCANVTATSPYYAGCAASGGLVNGAGNGDNTEQLRTINGGNPNLKPETAKIFTLGVVLEPRWVKNLSVTVDYWNFSVSNSITARGTKTILDDCLLGAHGNPADPSCRFITRGSDGIIQQVLDLNANVGGDAVDGIDIALRYGIPTDFGRFGLLFDGTWLHKFDRTLPNGTIIAAKGNFDLGIPNNGSFGTNPAWKFNAGVTYGLRGFGAGVNMRFIGAFEECGDADGNPAYCSPGQQQPGVTVYHRPIPAYTVWDLFLSYAFSNPTGRTSISAGIHNFLDIRPPVMYSAFTSGFADPSAYDFVGRFFYVRLTQAM